MAYFAEIKDNKVVNVILADSKEIAETVTGNLCIEYDDINNVRVNDLWDGEKFVAQIIEETPSE